MSRHVALLRGINVGGKNLIPMAELRGCFEEMGFADVETYIQSGNVVFSSRRASPATLAERIEEGLREAFGYGSWVLVLPTAELEHVVAQAPDGFGEQPDRYRYDVLFVRRGTKPAEVLAQVTTKAGVDTADAGDLALYFRRLIRKATQSHLSKLTQRPAYQNVTIRNWRTTTRLLAMASAQV